MKGRSNKNGEVLEMKGRKKEKVKSDEGKKKQTLNFYTLNQNTKNRSGLLSPKNNS